MFYVWEYMLLSLFVRSLSPSWEKTGRQEVENENVEHKEEVVV